jgi:general secretion pathway protein D
MQTVSVAAQTFFKTLGVDLTLPGKNIFFNDTLGMLFVRGTAEDLDTIESAIEVLNRVPPMVHIKARFIEVSQNDNAALGFDWYLGQFGSTVTASGGSEASQNVPVSAANPLGIFPGNTAASAVAGSAGDQLLTGGLQNSGPALATITGIMTDPNFRVVLHALEQRNGYEELNEPEVTVISGRQTQMKATDIEYILTGFEFDSGVNAPTPTTSTGTTIQSAANSAITPDTEQFEIGPTLDVVPVVLSDGYTINLTLIPELLEFDQYDTVPTVPGYTPAAATSSGGVSSLPTVLPHFTVRDVVTTVNIWDNQTVALGGLIASTIQSTKDKVPLLGDIPLLGRLFQSQSKTTQKKNLTIFVTATIIDPAGNRVHSDDELPFAQNAIPSQPAVPDQAFYPGAAASMTNALTN